MSRHPENFESFLKNSRDPGASAFRQVYQFAALAYAGCRLNSWCYSTKGKKLHYGFSEYPDELSGLFSLGRHLDFLGEHLDQVDPFLLSDSLDMMWIAEFDRSELTAEHPQPSLVFVLGPVFTSASSPAVITEKLRGLELSIESRLRLENLLHDIPVLSEGTFRQYARMLHFALTGDLAGEESLHLERANLRPEEESGEVTYEELRGGGVSLSRIMMTESQILSIIRSGISDPDRLSAARDIMAPADYTNGDALKNMKYELTAFCVRASAAAAEGGLPARSARTAELQFIRMISACRKLTELQDLFVRIVSELTEDVRRVRENPALSEPTLLAMEYIRANLTEPLTLSMIAGYTGYTEYYLSRRFHDEAGMRISEYISRERIAMAKELLTKTAVPIQEISDLLQFNSRSYFGQVFRRFTGQSPQEYRREATGGQERETAEDAVQQLTLPQDEGKGIRQETEG